MWYVRAPRPHPRARSLILAAALHATCALAVAGCAPQLWGRRVATRATDASLREVRAVRLGEAQSSAPSTFVYYPRSVLAVGSRLIVSEIYGNRVRIWNTMPAADGAPADITLGQPDADGTGANNPGVSAASMSEPWGIASDGTRLVVADRNNSRVLIWNAMPTATGQPADVVLGQADFRGRLVNGGAGAGAVNAASFNQTAGVAIAGGKLFVADIWNNRVLVWNSIPVANHTPADFALGQANLTANAAGTSATTLSRPLGVYSNGTRLYVADSMNHRVLVWDALPTAGGAPADRAIGQADLVSGVVNRGGAANLLTLNYPNDVTHVGSKLVVSDQSNQRLLAWDAEPTASGESASRAIGQPDGLSVTMNRGNGYTRVADGFNGPAGVSATPGGVWVADSGNYRVLFIPAAELGAGGMPSRVAGQPSLDEPTSGSCSPTRFGYARSFEYQGKIIVTDGPGHRVLIWNRPPTSDAAAPDVVLGQPGFTTCEPNGGGAVGPAGLDYPGGVTVYRGNLAVVDSNNHRLLIWNGIPTSSHEPAALVLGQPDFTTADDNSGNVTAQTFTYPWGVAASGDHLLLADHNNHRVLIWDNVTTSNQAASRVLGQPNFTTATENTGGLGAGSLNRPYAVDVVGETIWVSDSYNHRVLGWSAFPTVNGQAANLLLGQPDFTTNAAYSKPRADRSFDYPTGVTSVGDRLFVADGNNNRLLRFGSLHPALDAAAEEVFGQPDFLTTAPGEFNWIELSPAGAYFFMLPDYGANQVRLVPKLSMLAPSGASHSGIPVPVATAPTAGQSHLRLWLDAGQIPGAVNGDPLPSWPDASGAGRDGLQAASANRPTFRSGVVNGRAVVRFAGPTGQWFDFADPMAGATEGEIFAVVKANAGLPASVSSGWMHFTDVAIGQPNAVYPWAAWGYSYIFETFGVSVRKDYIGVTNTPVDRWRTYNVSAKLGDWNLRLDGEVVSHYTNETDVTFSPTVRIGTSYAAGTYNFDGDMAEIIVFDRVRTEQERWDLEAYLRAKYGHY